MNHFILQTLRKFDKLPREQTREILAQAIDEIDRLETAFDSIYLGILVCDAAHKLLLTNRYAKRLFAIRDFEHGSDHVWQLVHNDLIAGFLQTALLSGDKVEGREFEVETQRETLRLLSINVLPLVKLYHVTGTVIVIEDITQRRAHEARLRRVENLASLTTLAAGVAHEIKNPLASISIHIQLVQKMLEKERKICPVPEGERPVPFEKLKQHLEIAYEEMDRLNKTVVDFLFAVRPMDLNLIKSDLNQLINDIAALMSVEMENHGIKCELFLEKKLPFIKFDERYLKEAILNLVKNALDAMSEGGTLGLRTLRTDTDAVIEISDTGVGISAKEQAKIFEPYWTTKPSGTGLGLTLVFKIVREHRGEISVRSKIGEGSVFSVSLPLPSSERRLLVLKTETDAV
ncbi:MAG: ATP-binding protein [Termitinemataceae bacterium]|nr:MAG: ATP-binding protein [Termitinemataceae bacterium]